MVTGPAGLVPENYCAGEAQPSRKIGRPTPIDPQLSDSNKSLVLGKSCGLEEKIDWTPDCLL
jgi:hypothetical protein